MITLKQAEAFWYCIDTDQDGNDVLLIDAANFVFTLRAYVESLTDKLAEHEETDSCYQACGGKVVGVDALFRKFALQVNSTLALEGVIDISASFDVASALAEGIID